MAQDLVNEGFLSSVPVNSVTYPYYYYDYGSNNSIGGLIVTPLEKDFLRADAKLVESIFTEVTEPPDIIEKILEKLQ